MSGSKQTAFHSNRLPSLTGDLNPLPTIRASIVNSGDLPQLKEAETHHYPDPDEASTSNKVSATEARSSTEGGSGNEKQYKKRSSKQSRHSSSLIPPTEELQSKTVGETSPDAEKNNDGGWKEDEKRYERNRRLCRLMTIVAIIAVILLILFVVIVVTISVLYNNKVKIERLPETRSYPSSLRLSTPFSSELLNQDSQAFHLMAEDVCGQIESAYQNDELTADSFQGCLVDNFSQGSTIVNYTLIFTPNHKAEAQLEKGDRKMEYILADVLEANGAYVIPDFVPGSVAVTSTDEADVEEIALVQAMVQDQNCLVDPCSNNATCVDGLDTFFCVCAQGYTGLTCGIDIDDCLSQSCVYGECEDQIDGFICLCEPGFNGTLCDNNIDECSSDPCVHGNCTDGVNSFSCSCDAGYEGDTCGIDTDDCAADPCAATGVCEDQIDGFICLCEPGFNGTLCDNNIDECSSDLCVHGNCTDGVNSFSCSCDAGYEGDTCSINTDDCAAYPCAATGECEDQLDGFICLCEPGFNGTLCDNNIDECSSDPCVHGNCTDGVNSFSCSCDAGYEGDTCGIDTDDCLVEPCAATGICIDLVDSFMCECDSGYTGALCDTDIDDCDPDPCAYGTCSDSGTDSFSCSCDTGYEGDTCKINIDDCEGDPCTGNSTVCYDMVDGYVCSCALGFAGSDCDIDIDECASNPCPDACVDEIAGFRCVCRPGYTGALCQEIDYCCLNKTVTEVPTLSGSFYSYGPGTDDDLMDQGDDGCPLTLDFSTIVFGIPHSQAYICYNGMISLDGAVGGFNSSPFPLSSGYAVLAAYWTDLDMRCSSSLYTRIDTTSCVLDRASTEVQLVYGGSFYPVRALIVTWLNAETFPCSSNSETVSLQMVVVTDDVDTYAMYIYGDMQWGITPQVGFDAGDGINYYAIDGSRTDAMLNIEETSNVNVIGKYMFKVSQSNITAPDEPVCGDPCNGNGQCINDPDNEDYTCSCFSGYSGDGCLTGLGSC